jgi:hypothetical protein
MHIMKCYFVVFLLHGLYTALHPFLFVRAGAVACRAFELADASVRQMLWVVENMEREVREAERLRISAEVEEAKLKQTATDLSVSDGLLLSIPRRITLRYCQYGNFAPRRPSLSSHGNPTELFKYHCAASLVGGAAECDKYS